MVRQQARGPPSSGIGCASCTGYACAPPPPVVVKKEDQEEEDAYLAALVEANMR